MAKTKSSQIKAESQSLASKILETIAKIDRPADFCTNGQCPMMLPGLNVKGIGDIGLPLTPTEAKRMIKACRQAPYGKGTETVVDTKIRKVWELDPEQFSLKNPKWPSMLDVVLREVETNLGLPNKSLAAHLYKLLVYEKGGFFLPHRDGEKLDRMVATLVINLPSKHSGGELVVHHEVSQTTISMPGAAAGLEVDYAAFYADCQHEVKPLLSGYRLCLTYNLVLAKPRSKISVSAPSFHEVADGLVTTLKQWSDGTDTHAATSTKIAVTLEHRYTQAGLLIDKLKGIDLAKAEVLFNAAEKANCDAHLALVTLWQSGSAEGGYDDYSYGRGRGYSRWDDDYDNEEDDDENHHSEHTMGEIYDSSLSADHWSNRQGKKVAFGKIQLNESEIVSNFALTETDASREEFEGYTGNAGMTLERWYHLAAIVIWPQSHQFKVWCDAGTDAAIAGLEQMISKQKKAKKADREEKLEQCRQFAFQIVESWHPGRSMDDWDTDKEKTKTKRESMFDSLAELDQPLLVQRLIEEVMPEDADLMFSKQFLRWIAKQGWTAFTNALTAMATQSSADTLNRDIMVLRQIATLRDSDRARTKLCKQLAPLIVHAIEKFDPKASNQWSFPRWDRTQIVIDMVSALSFVDDERLLNRFLSWLSIHPRYGLTEVQIPAVVKLAPMLKKAMEMKRAVKNWIKGMKTELLSRTKSEPMKPSNWKRQSELSCSCADCARLSMFLADPTQPEARFPLASARRRHLHSQIDQHQCDCTHETLRVGSPQLLVCKKTNANYARECKAYEQDLKHLSVVQKIGLE